MTGSYAYLNNCEDDDDENLDNIHEIIKRTIFHVNNIVDQVWELLAGFFEYKYVTGGRG